MTYQAIHNAIRNQFQTAVVDASSNLASNDIAWDNTAFNTHDAGDSGAWVRFSILGGESEQIGLGSTTLRARGIIVASLFVTAEEGDKLGLEIADEIVSAFNTKSFTHSGNTVITQNPSVEPIGRDGAWYQINVSIPYLSDNAN